MKLTRYQTRRAKYLGESQQIEQSGDAELQRKAREIRAENIRRTAAAS